ncbi:SDR family oxidoreductase [Halotalea alkalilenta]|uniref:SDR family oxidoreductase n=1 Tax=Halotalea alkalilenta TaxID=376489 RepID=UPI00047F7862|nr:SDR family oxidoreductase [Halotalea alkalilenta]
MDLGIAGRWALVCAASKGLGRASAAALAREGVNLVVNARDPDTLVDTAAWLRTLDPTIEVIAVPGDITTASVRETALAAAPQLDILVNNAGGPPPGDFRNWTAQDWQRAVNANMITPIELIKACVDDMAARGFGRVVNITSSSVKAPIEALGLSNGARAGLTGFVAGIARQARLASNNVTINNLLPGSFDTGRLRSNLASEAKGSGKSVEQTAEERQAKIPAGRFGDPDEFGALCAFLCSALAGYLTGQNVLLDGGAYPGTF